MLGFISGLLGPPLETAAGQSGIYKVQREEEAAGWGPRRCLQTSESILCQTAKERYANHWGRSRQRSPHQRLSMQTILPGQLSHKQERQLCPASSQNHLWECGRTSLPSIPFAFLNWSLFHEAHKKGNFFEKEPSHALELSFHSEPRQQYWNVYEVWECRKDGQEVLRLSDLTTEKNLQDLCFWWYTCVPYFSTCIVSAANHCFPALLTLTFYWCGPFL